MLTIGRIAYRREGGDGSAHLGRSVIYDCLVCYVIGKETRLKVRSRRMPHLDAMQRAAINMSSLGLVNVAACTAVIERIRHSM